MSNFKVYWVNDRKRHPERYQYTELDMIVKLFINKVDEYIQGLIN